MSSRSEDEDARRVAQWRAARPRRLSEAEACLAEIRRLYRRLPPRGVYRAADDLALIATIYRQCQVYLALPGQAMQVLWEWE